ncbi:small multi-drug export protein [Evansella sp. AB-rgal1]|uniref:small multi-drug export protein n=1 Tax=Evansella sp. AB-rgal1 TaxID=3242696 RepID=UPI00359F1054
MINLDLILQYLLIFIMAATPWLEILVVIPLGIAIGLHPVYVGIVSFIGNFIPILLIIYLMNCFSKTNWYIKRKERSSSKKKGRNEKALRIFHKYGLPGLAFLGPLLTGIHLAAIIALSLHADKTKTTIWMGISLIIWSVMITISAFYSIDWLTRWF